MEIGHLLLLKIDKHVDTLYFVEEERRAQLIVMNEKKWQQKEPEETTGCQVDDEFIIRLMHDATMPLLVVLCKMTLQETGELYLMQPYLRQIKLCNVKSLISRVK